MTATNDLQHRTIDELNAVICIDCRRTIMSALHFGLDCTLCDRCNLILDEMKRRMQVQREATATRH